MKVALIAPCKEDQRWRGRKSRFVWPPLGLMILGALTPERVELRLIDEAVENLDPTTLDCDLAAISILTANAPRGYGIADALRSRGVKVILGGIHASMLPEEAQAHGSVCVGEGEGLWGRILEDAASEKGLSPIYRAEGYCDPGEIPTPRRSLLKPGVYGVPGTLMATRGCPYNCSFCSTTLFMGNRFRLRPVEKVVEDLASIQQRWCIFLDDNLFANRRYAKELLQAILPFRRRWVAQTSMNAAKDPELLALARRAGCMGVLVGFESLSTENLADVRKGINRVEEYKEAVDAFHQAGIFVQGSFIFGFDGDPEDIFEATLRFVETTPLEGANFSILTPLPGTDVYKRLEGEGRIIERDWSRFDKLNVCFRLKNGDPEELKRRVKNLYRRVYSYRSILRRVRPFSRRGVFTPQGFTALLFNLAYRRGVMRGWDDA